MPQTGARTLCAQVHLILTPHQEVFIQAFLKGFKLITKGLGVHDPNSLDRVWMLWSDDWTHPRCVKNDHTPRFPTQSVHPHHVTQGIASPLPRKSHEPIFFPKERT